MVTGQVVPNILKDHSAFNFSVMQANKNGCVGQTLCVSGLGHFIFVTYSHYQYPVSTLFRATHLFSITYFLFSFTQFYYYCIIFQQSCLTPFWTLHGNKNVRVNTALPQTSAVQVSNACLRVHTSHQPLCCFTNAPASNYNPHGSSPSVVNYYPHHIPIYTLFVPRGSSSWNVCP